MSGRTKTNGGLVAEWENDEAERFRRPRRPVEVRRRAPWKRTLARLGRVTLVTGVVAAVSATGLGIYWFTLSAELFRVPDTAAVAIANHRRVDARAVRDRFAADAGQSVFQVPLEERRKSLEEMVWIERATVQRVLPNRLAVHLEERRPVAFLRRGASLWLVDSAGVILPPPESAEYTFPVITGLPDTLSTQERRERVRRFLDFVQALDAGGKDYSARLSEVDVSDPAGVRATVIEQGEAVWLLFGRGRVQEKFEAYLEHRSLWQESGEPVRRVDLRYRGQLILNPEEPPASARRKKAPGKRNR